MTIIFIIIVLNKDYMNNKKCNETLHMKQVDTFLQNIASMKLISYYL